MVSGGTHQQARSVVRIHDAAGEVVGGGFLIGPDLVATCAHVVAEAVGCDPYAAAPPSGQVRVDVPMAPDPAGPLAATVHRWSPIASDGTGDVAVLRLDRPAPAGARMPPLRRIDELWDHPYRVLGFPDGQSDGVWATGRIRGEQGTRWFQLQGAAGDQPIEAGFSGSPVWDESSGAVVGMTVAVDRNTATTTAYVIPIEQVLGLDPEVLPCPYRGLEPFGEEHAAFFFGREDDVDRLVAALEEHTLVAVAGRSGIGKSSLVRAGLLPRVRASGWRVAELLPEVVTAAGAVRAAVEAARSRPAVPPAERVAPAPGGPVAGSAAVGQVVEVGLAPVLVVVDQFEELAAAEPAAARRVLRELSAAVAEESVRAVLTVRWEAFTELTTPASGAAGVLDVGARLVAGTVVVGAMDRSQLREAVVRPAERAPGLSFEDGLVERILDDAVSEPGQLPLVESLLAQLWDRREGGALTLAAYTATGGVPGAIAQRAEDLVETFSDDPGHARLRRLFTALTRPDIDGRFLRRPVALAELAPELRELVPRLAGGRLLVVQRETVELAHQALIDHWPRLRGWLAEDREFLAWRAQIGQQRERWAAADHDDGALLRGAALAASAQWLPAREADLATADHDYLRRSRSRQRREVRRWRVVTATLAVLVLVAGGLAAVAYSRGNDLDAQLRMANAQVLASASLGSAPDDPDLAARLAIAAYRADPRGPGARAALLAAVLATATVTDVHTDLAGDMSKVVAGADGDVLLAADEPGRFVVLSGLAEGAPQRWVVEQPDVSWVQLSKDGRWVVTGGAGNARLWDVGARTSTDLPFAGPESSSSPIEFAAGGDRLGWVAPAHGGERAVVLYDLGARASIAHRLPPVVDQGMAQVIFTADPQVIGIGYGAVNEGPSRLEVRSLATGELLRGHGEDAAPAAGGELIVTCTEGSDAVPAVLTVTDTASGAERRRITSDWKACSNLRITADDRHVVQQRLQPYTGGVVAIRVIDLLDGSTYDGYRPLPPKPAHTEFGYDSRITAVRTRSGAVELLQGTERSLLRMRTWPEPDWNGLEPVRNTAYARGAGILSWLGRDFATFDRATGALTSTDPSGRSATTNASFSVAGDTLHLLRRTERGSTLAAYALPGFEPLHTITVNDANGNPWLGPSTARVGGGRAAIAAGDHLTVWDARTGAHLGGPFQLDGNAATTTVSLAIRPGRPGEVAVVDGAGAVELWDTDRGVRIATFSGPEDGPAERTWIAFAPDGERLAVLTVDGKLRMWDVATRAPAVPPSAVPQLATLRGVTADGYVALNIELESSGRRLLLWDPVAGRQSGSLDLSLHLGAISVDGTTIEQDGLGWLTPLPLPATASGWVERLCTFADRPFSPSEAALLPAGIDPGSPCTRE
ncbi:trypsin-like peptidase domain-containing protein [Actinomycetes bacterium KLBMP 9759]